MTDKMNMLSDAQQDRIVKNVIAKFPNVKEDQVKELVLDELWLQTRNEIYVETRRQFILETR